MSIDNKGMIFCVGCKYIGTNSTRDAAKYRCFAPQNELGYDLVTGNKTYRHETCYGARSNEADTCGTAAMWFEYSPVKPIDTATDAHIAAGFKYSAGSKALSTGMDLSSDPDQLAAARIALATRLADLKAGGKLSAPSARKLTPVPSHNLLDLL